MKLSKKFVALIAAAALFSATAGHADECYYDNGGCAYDDCCRTTSLAPAIALGAIALVAIIAVAVQNTSGSSHSH